MLYEFWIEADNIFNIFSLYGRERDKYTESGTAGQIVRKRDCPAKSGTVGMYGNLTLFLQEEEVFLFFSNGADFLSSVSFHVSL